ncbi:hypothetical protein EDC96DRAFT_413888, partial [Choanephora cucurbitarum]
IKWTNNQLKSGNSKTWKPNFLVHNLSSRVKCIVLIAEFKRPDQNSYIEPDLMKFGKQMKLTLNNLVSSGVADPKVC